MQLEFCDRAEKYLIDRGIDDEQTRDVLSRWQSTLARLESDPMSLVGELDWVAKLAVLEGYRERDNLDWDSARLGLVDIQYSDVRPEKGIAQLLMARGSLARVTTDDEVQHAISNPPVDTRAWFRGECIRRFGEYVAAASWDSVIFDLPGRDTLIRVPTLEPLRGSRANVGELLDSCQNVGQLLAALETD